MEQVDSYILQPISNLQNPFLLSVEVQLLLEVVVL